MEESVSGNIWHDRRYFKATSPTDYNVYENGNVIGRLTFNQFWMFDDGDNQRLIESTEELRQIFPFMKYSQNDEQHYILDFFNRIQPRHGRKILEIGAYDGITFSNTYALLEQGWHGVLIEASPKMFTALQRNTAGKNVDLVNSCIVMEPVTGMITFYDNDQATASTCTAHVENWKGTTPFSPIQVMPVHYEAILSRFGRTFDFVNIDIEGQSAELFLRMFPLMPDVDLWVVEHDSRKEEITALAQGFSVLYENGENVVLGRL